MLSEQVTRKLNDEVSLYQCRRAGPAPGRPVDAAFGAGGVAHHTATNAVTIA